MKLLPDSPRKLAVGLVVVILLADTIGLSQQVVAVFAIVFTGFCGWLIVRKRRIEPVSESFLGTSTPLYTYGLLGFGSASVLAVLGLMNTGFDVVSRLLEWNWEGFGLSSLEPLVPALVVGVCSVGLLALHVLRDRDGAEE